MGFKNIGFWLRRAEKKFRTLPPGMPSADDLRLYNKYAEFLRRSQAESGKPGLLLGCTPLIADWCRENGLRVAVMDYCEPLARSLGDRELEIIVDDWLSTSYAGASFSWAAGDGIVNAVGSGRDSIGLFRQIHRLLLPGSLLILRNLLRPVPTPSTREIFEKYAAGGIRSLNALQHQISSSLQPSFMEGILTRETYRVISENRVVPPEQLASLDYYNLEGACLCYPTLAELQALASADFEQLDMDYGDYEMSALTPTLVYRVPIRKPSLVAQARER